MIHRSQLPSVLAEIKKLSAEGLSSRQIAKVLTISKSTVNNVLRRSKKPKCPKILYLDLETSAALAYTFTRFDVTIGQNNIVEEGGKILVASWKWANNPTVYSVNMTRKEIKNGDDSRICQILMKLFEEADIVVMHNGKSFDKRMLQTRITYHGGHPLAPVKIYDTYQIAKKNLRLPSNSLDNIAAYFGLGRKISVDIKLWIDVQNGSSKAMKEMVSYCKQDVLLLVEISKILLGFGAPGVNVSLFLDSDAMHCKACGSADVMPTQKTIQTGAGVYQEYVCQSCGHSQRDNQNLLDKSKRKSILK